MAATFDGATYTVTLDPLVPKPTAGSIYSDWKRWVLSGVGAGILPAFDIVGGDEIDSAEGLFVGSYFFFRNDIGWRMKPPEVHGEYDIQGNLFPRAPATEWKLGTTGNFNTSFDRTVSSLVTTKQVNTGSVVTAQDKVDIASASADEVWAAAIRSLTTSSSATLSAQNIVDIAVAVESQLADEFSTIVVDNSAIALAVETQLADDFSTVNSNIASIPTVTPPTANAIALQVESQLADDFVALNLNIDSIIPATPPTANEIALAVEAILVDEIAALNANIDDNDVSALVAAIKAKTDQLIFSVANQVDSNTKSQNQATIYGAGTSGDLWRGTP